MIKTLFNPFEKFSERPLILFGIATTVLLSFTSAYFNARFDGVLDLHFYSNTFFLNTLMDNVLNVAVLSLALYTLGKIRNAKTRFIDIFAASLISRIPYYLLPVLNWNNVILLETEKVMQQFMTMQPNGFPELEGGSLVLLSVFAVISVIVLAWFLYLLYQGYKVATNAKGILEVVLFAIAVIAAEIFSKIIFYFLN